MLRDAADYSLANPSAAMTSSGDRTFASLVPEFAKLWMLNFHFREPLDSYTNVQTIALALRKFPPHEVFSAESLVLEPNLKVGLWNCRIASMLIAAFTLSVLLWHVSIRGVQFNASFAGIGET